MRLRRFLQLGYRFAHVLRRMLPIALHLLAKEGAGLTGHDLFLKRVGACFHAFVEEGGDRHPHQVPLCCRVPCAVQLTSYRAAGVRWSQLGSQSPHRLAGYRGFAAVDLVQNLQSCVQVPGGPDQHDALCDVEPAHEVERCPDRHAAPGALTLTLVNSAWSDQCASCHYFSHLGH